MPEPPAARNGFTEPLSEAFAVEKAGDIPAALAAYRKILAEDPEHIRLRCYIGRLLIEEGKAPEAESLMREGLEIQPESVSICRTLARALAEQGRYEEAIDIARDLILPLKEDKPFRYAYASWLAKWSEQVSSAPHLRHEMPRVAALWDELDRNEQAIADDWAAELEARQPDGDVAALDRDQLRAMFDTLAEIFDYHLGRLGYKAPQALRAAVDRVLPGRANLDIIDLGCGTGMVGELFRPLARRLMGIDLSPRMVLRAQRRGIYDKVIEGEIVEVLKEQTRLADLVLGADLLIYVGDSEALFKQAAKNLRHDGCLAVTVEKLETPEPRFELRPTQRFAHSEAYIRKLAEAAALNTVLVEEFDLRMENREMIKGLVCVLQKRA